MLDESVTFACYVYKMIFWFQTKFAARSWLFLMVPSQFVGHIRLGFSLSFLFLFKFFLPPVKKDMVLVKRRSIFLVPTHLIRENLVVQKKLRLIIQVLLRLYYFVKT